jgi:hypothetical protein
MGIPFDDLSLSPSLSRKYIQTCKHATYSCTNINILVRVSILREINLESVFLVPVAYSSSLSVHT